MTTKTMNSNRIVKQIIGSFLLVLQLILSSHQEAVAQPFSPSAQVSLLTFGSGEELYSVFGHTAIRIYDPTQNIDRTYGWGGFRFAENNFYLKFLRGTLPYYIDAYEMYVMMYAYQAENRTIREQVLNLSPGQKQQLFTVLATNMLPENRTYQYKFFYDNCATRPRDVIAKACGDSLMMPSRSRMTGKSYRDWMNDYLGEKAWAKLGMNLAIGQPADEQTDGWHAMYLPENVYDQMAQAKLKQASGQVVPLVARDQTLFTAAKTFPHELPFILDPNVVFTLFGIIVALFTARRYQAGKVDRWLDRWLFGIVGFLGWFLFLLWVGTDHGVTAWNPTLFYMMPLHLPLIYWATSSKTTSRRRTTYFSLTALLILLGMIFSKVPGGFDVVFPLTLLIRCIVNIQMVRRGYQTPARVA
ncbi:DUF4105 domain-containing protein [Spirosoma endbachense]|uniref:DUF4105 domain-containing protein n=2 Tax=Spirosoma endbachense TaxID=2666025 RepID=A0A6P1W9P4_9BACT|nr:DUF4105 domain-containing protein [Spirosoma endbachense]